MSPFTVVQESLKWYNFCALLCKYLLLGVIYLPLYPFTIKKYFIEVATSHPVWYISVFVMQCTSIIWKVCIALSKLWLKRGKMHPIDGMVKGKYKYVIVFNLTQKNLHAGNGKPKYFSRHQLQ